MTARTASRFWLWRFPAAVGGAAALVFAAGFALALRGTLGEPIGQTPPPLDAAPAALPSSGAVRVLVLGDSLARGTGDDSGKGFAVDVVEALRRRGSTQSTNLAVNGLESPELVSLVESRNVRALAASADLILLSIGGNDLSHALPRGSNATEAVDALGDARLRFARNLRAVLGALREVNARAPIVLLSLYDPFGPRAAPGRLGASVILQWNALIQETALAFPEVVVVPTFDLFENRADRLAADRYHPNRKGYEEIARRILQVLPPG